MGSATGEPWKDRSEHVPRSHPVLRRKRECKETSRESIQDLRNSVVICQIVRFKQDITEEALVAVRVMTC